jgi:hypothetical protein
VVATGTCGGPATLPCKGLAVRPFLGSVLGRLFPARPYNFHQASSALQLCAHVQHAPTTTLPPLSPPDQPFVGINVKLPVESTVTLPAPPVGLVNRPTTNVLAPLGRSFASTRAPAPGLYGELKLPVYVSFTAVTTTPVELPLPVPPLPLLVGWGAPTVMTRLSFGLARINQSGHDLRTHAFVLSAGVCGEGCSAYVRVREFLCAWVKFLRETGRAHARAFACACTFAWAWACACARVCARAHVLGASLKRCVVCSCKHMLHA